MRNRLENTGRDRHSLDQQAAALKSELAALDTEVLATQARLAALGGSDVSDSLVRYESMRERARGLMALLAERRRGVERDRGGLLDADLIASLEAEAARVANELADVETQARALGPEADRVAQAEAALADERAALADGGLPEMSEPGAVPLQRAGEVRGELAARRGAIERTVGELARVEARLAAIEARAAQLAADTDLHKRACEQAEEAERPLVSRVQAAEARPGVVRARPRQRTGRAPGRRRRPPCVVGARARRSRSRSTTTARALAGVRSTAQSARSPISSRSTTAGERRSKQRWARH